MADKSFDVVIVGGGNKALIAAMYLTKDGKLRVGIFEERDELGGGWGYWRGGRSWGAAGVRRSRRPVFSAIPARCI